MSKNEVHCLADFCLEMSKLDWPQGLPFGQTIANLCADASALDRLNVVMHERDYTPREERRREKLEARIRRLLDLLSCGCDIQGDTRGPSVIVFVPSYDGGHFPIPTWD